MKRENNIAKSSIVVNKLKNIENKLSELLYEKEELLVNLVEYVLLLGTVDPKTGYSINQATLEQLVNQEYADVISNKELENKKKLFGIISELYKIVYGTDKLIAYNIEQASKHGYKYQQYREEIKQGIIEIFFPGGDDINESENNSNIIGEIEVRIDNMEL